MEHAPGCREQLQAMVKRWLQRVTCSARAWMQSAAAKLGSQTKKHAAYVVSPRMPEEQGCRGLVPPTTSPA